MFRNLLFEVIIRNCWFEDGNSLGVTFRHLFADDNGTLRNEVLALVATGVRF